MSIEYNLDGYTDKVVKKGKALNNDFVLLLYSMERNHRSSPS